MAQSERPEPEELERLAAIEARLEDRWERTVAESLERVGFRKAEPEATENLLTAARSSWEEAVREYRSAVEADRAALNETDDADYDEIRRAVGRGAPTVLLGTSSKSLEANLRKIEAAQQARSPGAPPPDPTGRIRPGRFHRAALLVLIALLGLSTLLLILIWDRQSSLANAIQTSMLVVACSFLVLPKIWRRYHKSEKIHTVASGVARVELRRHAKGDSSPKQSEQAAKEKKG
jgi:hypothetical protein